MMLTRYCPILILLFLLNRVKRRLKLRKGDIPKETVVFNQLEVGAGFILENIAYIKIYDTKGSLGEPVNAVSLAGGNMICVPTWAKVNSIQKVSLEV